jgi:hypothetical protein
MPASGLHQVLERIKVSTEYRIIHKVWYLVTMHISLVSSFDEVCDESLIHGKRTL